MRRSLPLSENRPGGASVFGSAEPAIVLAIEAGDLDAVRRLVDADKDIVRQSLDTDTPDQPLHYAAWQGKRAIAAFLIDQGAALNARGDLGQTPLHYAARHGNPDVAELLLDRGADLNLEDDNGFTALFTASRGREAECFDVAELLERRGAKAGLNDWICLGRLEKIKELLDKDAHACGNARFPGYLIEDMVMMINGRILEKGGLEGDREAAAAVVAETLPVLKRMLDQGADANAGFGTALFYAVQMPRTEVAELLLERGAKAKQDQGWDLLKKTVSKPMQDVLVRHGAW